MFHTEKITLEIIFFTVQIKDILRFLEHKKNELEGNNWFIKIFWFFSCMLFITNCIILCLNGYGISIYQIEAHNMSNIK